MSDTGKIAEVLFESALETYEHQDKMLDLVNFIQPDASTMQNAGNVIWRPYQQHAPIIDGWDLTGQEQDVIEETYPSILGTPKNDFIKQRADDLRDTQFWEKRGEQSGRKQATEQNRLIANAIAIQGSKFYRSSVTSGYDFVSEGQAILNETQQADNGRCFVLNDRDNRKFGVDLAARQTLQGRPEMTWKTGQIGQNIAQFDVYNGSFLPNLAGGADPATTVTGDQSFAPEGGTVNTSTGTVTNVDARRADIPVAASGSYAVGDKVQFENGGTPVQSIGLADKNASGEPMTFTIVEIPDATTITVYPKPIALDDPALNATEAAYANIDTQILNGATVNRLNIDTTNKTNLFFEKDAVEVIGGTVPANFFKEFDGMKVISSRMSNGQEMYMIYDGKIDEFTFRWRIFSWYGITIANPQNCGVAVTF